MGIQNESEGIFRDTNNRRLWFFMCRRVVLALLVMCVTLTTSAQEFVSFPYTLANIDAIRDFIKLKKLSLVTNDHVIPYEDGVNFYIVTYNTGSGISSIYTHIYVCARMCRLWANRYSGQEVLTASLSKAGHELILESEKKVIYLRIPLSTAPN